MIFAANGRVHVTVPDLFEVSLTVGGSDAADQWHLLNMEFLVNLNTTKTMQTSRFKIEGMLRDRILDMGNHLLSEEAMQAAQTDNPQSGFAKLPKAPLVRIFNFLRR